MIFLSVCCIFKWASRTPFMVPAFWATLSAQGGISALFNARFWRPKLRIDMLRSTVFNQDPWGAPRIASKWSRPNSSIKVMKRPTRASCVLRNVMLWSGPPSVWRRRAFRVWSICIPSCSISLADEGDAIESLSLTSYFVLIVEKSWAQWSKTSEGWKVASWSTTWICPFPSTPPLKNEPLYSVGMFPIRVTDGIILAYDQSWSAALFVFNSLFAGTIAFVLIRTLVLTGTESPTGILALSSCPTNRTKQLFNSFKALNTSTDQFL